MPNYEKNIFENLDQENTHDKAVKILRENEIKLADFSDLYGNSVIEEDEKYTQEKENIFHEQMTPQTAKLLQLAEILEAIIFEAIEQQNWFGENAFTIKTSRFDDIKNGIDTVVEFVEEDSSASHLALAVDATFNQDLDKKFDRIKGEIDRGELATIKYFISDNMHFRGELKNIPRAVVGAEVKTIKELARLWIERKNKELAEHPILFQVLEELLIQFKEFEKYAIKTNQDSIAQKYGLAKTKIEKILAQKRKKILDTGIRDDVFSSIKYAAQALNE
jgi:hypothetical protein